MIFEWMIVAFLLLHFVSRFQAFSSAYLRWLDLLFFWARGLWLLTGWRVSAFELADLEFCYLSEGLVIDGCWLGWHACRCFKIVLRGSWSFGRTSRCGYWQNWLAIADSRDIWSEERLLSIIKSAWTERMLGMSVSLLMFNLATLRTTTWNKENNTLSNICKYLLDKQTLACYTFLLTQLYLNSVVAHSSRFHSLGFWSRVLILSSSLRFLFLFSFCLFFFSLFFCFLLASFSSSVSGLIPLSKLPCSCLLS